MTEEPCQATQKKEVSHKKRSEEMLRFQFLFVSEAKIHNDFQYDEIIKEKSRGKLKVCAGHVRSIFGYVKGIEIFVVDSYQGEELLYMIISVRIFMPKHVIFHPFFRIKSNKNFHKLKELQKSFWLSSRESFRVFLGKL